MTSHHYMLLGMILCWRFAWPWAACATENAPPQDIQRQTHYDVVIAGAGTGGFAAAVQSARMGMSVLLLEETDWIGGQMNAAAVTSMDEGPVSIRELVRERGIYHEFIERVEANYRPLGISPETAYWRSHIGVEPRIGQKILYAMLDKARATMPLDISLRSTVTKVIKDGDTVTGVVVDMFTPQGNRSRTVNCKILIDATEWGDVIPLTGARYRVGNCVSDLIAPRRKVQMLTWTMVIKQYPQGVPTSLQIETAPPGFTREVQDYFAKSLGNGEKISSTNKPWTWATFIGYRGMPDSSPPERKGQVTRTHLNYSNDYEVLIADVEDPATRLTTLRAAQLKTLHLLHYIQNVLGKKDWSIADDEGYDSPYNRQRVDQWLKDRPDLEPYRPILYHFPVMAYARESRRIIGLHTLTAREIERNPGKPRLFESVVAIGDYAVDLHGSMTPQFMELDLDRAEDLPTRDIPRGTGPFGIPFECFIPEKVDGFLPAEKNISQSRLANGATRLQPSTMLTGQAAGAIAAISIQHQVRPRDLDPVLVQTALLDAGSTLYLPPLKDVVKDSLEWKAIQLVVVHGMLPPAQTQFNMHSVVTGEELVDIVKKLSGKTSGGTPLNEPITRKAFAQIMQPVILASGVKADFASIPDPSTPITRLEATRLIAHFLQLRAVAKLKTDAQTITWPASQTPMP